MTPPEVLRRTVRERVLAPPSDRDAPVLARAVVSAGRGEVAGVIFFGSRKTGADPDPWSAYDLFVLVRGYQAFYRAMHEGGILRRPPRLAAALNTVLPPNQISFVAAGGDGVPRRAKLSIITPRAFARETSSARHDHFCLGRLFQPTEVLYAADDEVRETVLQGLVSVHALTYAWARPYLPSTFDAAAYARTLLRVSLAGEIRPEPSARRAERLFQAQREYLEPVYTALLDGLAEQGELQRAPAGYALRRPVSFGERVRVAAYFRGSLLRATARWLKYVVTFEGWLEYIMRKAERHTGRPIVLTERERRLPVIFLWPRLVRYLREKDRT